MDQITIDLKKLLTVKNIIRFLAFCCLIIFFLPTCVVSCTGFNVEVSAAKAMTGVKAEGNDIQDPYPIMVFTLLLPLIIIVISFVNQIVENREKLAIGIIAGATVVDFIFYICYSIKTKEIAEELKCQFKNTVWFGINSISLILIFILCILVFIGLIHFKTSIIDLFVKSSDNNTVISDQNQIQQDQQMLNRSESLEMQNMQTSDQQESQ